VLLDGALKVGGVLGRGGSVKLPEPLSALFALPTGESPYTYSFWPPWLERMDAVIAIAKR
jgi:hypothetical protein